jgi:starch phosphorylase
VGKALPLEATIRLGQIAPNEVQVQVYHGALNPQGDLTDGTATELKYDSSSDGVHLFKGSIECASSGRFGFALRVLPRHEALVTPFATKLIYWA